MNKLIVKKKLIIRVLLVIEAITMLLIVISLSKRNAYNLAEMKIKKDEGLFAIMIGDENGEYIRSDSNTFPTGYDLNIEMSKCQDNNGEIIPDILSFNSDKVNVRTTKTVYCYLYFDKKDDLKIAVSTDGTSGKAPTTLNYRKNITCNSATSSWNYKYNRLVFDNIGEAEKCNLTFTKDTSTKNYLSTKITNMKGNTSGTGSIVDEGSAGIRYEGQNPNNYIWFNNEMWRIIGVIPTKNASGTTENLVKIIRNESLGGYAYDAKSSDYTGAWGSNTLYRLLKYYYWGKNNGTNTDYCYGDIYNGTTVKSKCDYQVKGIESTDYYGSMVKEVYWNTGASDTYVTVSAAYANEIKKQTVKGYVGLMNASDFGYATSGSHETKIQDYANATHTLGNWLYSNTYEWTITQFSIYTTHALDVLNRGNVLADDARYSYGVRPVLYLDSKVYIISGDGSEANPYIVARES